MLSTKDWRKRGLKRRVSGFRFFFFNNNKLRKKINISDLYLKERENRVILVLESNR